MFTIYKEPEKLAGSGMDSAGHPGPDSPTQAGLPRHRFLLVLRLVIIAARRLVQPCGPQHSLGISRQPWRIGAWAIGGEPWWKDWPICWPWKVSKTWDFTPSKMIFQGSNIGYLTIKMVQFFSNTGSKKTHFDFWESQGASDISPLHRKNTYQTGS